MKDTIRDNSQALHEFGESARAFYAAMRRFEVAKNEMEKRVAIGWCREPRSYFLNCKWESGGPMPDRPKL